MTVPLELPKAIDLSHHLNHIARNRFASPLKDILHYMAMPGMISLAGGMPHPSLFPFADANISVYPPTADLKHGVVPAPSERVSLEIPKTAAVKGGLDLNAVMQYGPCLGLTELRTFLHKFTHDVYQPAYADFEVLLHEGNTAAWAKVCRLLLNSGDYVLLEEFSFPSSFGPWVPDGCKGVPIKMDEHGLRADDLDRVLTEWETTHPGERRPRVLYSIAVGQNPCGTSMPADRMQDVYDVCVKHDVIVVEDSPYHTLSFRPFEITPEPAEPVPMSGDEFKRTLAPSYLKFDYQGRVIRLDSFSKTLAPGSRLGYFVANPLFTERLLRATEVESQTPSGWSMAIVSQLLHTWGQDGYLQWLSNLRDSYELRRNIMCAALAQQFVALPAEKYAHQVAGCEGIALYPRGTDPASIKPDQQPVASFVAPAGGMFLWIRFYLAAAPRFAELEAAGHKDPEGTFTQEMWKALADNHVLLTPGSYYVVPSSSSSTKTTDKRSGERGVGYFRFAFSYGDRAEMEEGIRRVEEVTSKLWGY
ncbi:hypothetical protein JCM10449v2_004384 [Rhodotorula kratochvilovae]